MLVSVVVGSIKDAQGQAAMANAACTAPNAHGRRAAVHENGLCATTYWPYDAGQRRLRRSGTPSSGRGRHRAINRGSPKSHPAAEHLVRRELRRRILGLRCPARPNLRSFSRQTRRGLQFVGEVTGPTPVPSRTASIVRSTRASAVLKTPTRFKASRMRTAGPSGCQTIGSM